MMGTGSRDLKSNMQLQMFGLFLESVGINHIQNLITRLSIINENPPSSLIAGRELPAVGPHWFVTFRLSVADKYGYYISKNKPRWLAVSCGYQRWPPGVLLESFAGDWFAFPRSRRPPIELKGLQFIFAIMGILIHTGDRCDAWLL